MMTIEKVPFVNYTLDQDKKDKKRETLNVSFNLEEWTKVKQAQDFLNVAQEGTAVKIVFEIGLNVLLTTLGEQNLRYLTNKTRKKLND